MNVLADLSRPDHVEHSAWVAEITGSDGLSYAFLSIPAVNRALADQF